MGREQIRVRGEGKEQIRVRFKVMEQTRVRVRSGYNQEWLGLG